MSDTLQRADIGLIMQILPQKPPFLMVDRVIDIDDWKSGTGIKNVSVSEPALIGHFDGDPVFPGVLIIEAMAQTAGVICGVGTQTAIGGEDGNGRVVIAAVDGCRFKQMVFPGDQLELHIKTKRGAPGARIWQFAGEARVDGKVVCVASFTGMYDATPKDDPS
jgi:3-hydroxyacyl-[acyl-carrier-protein] dehydratase